MRSCVHAPHPPMGDPGPTLRHVPAHAAGGNGTIIAFIEAGVPFWQPFLVLAVAIGFTFLAERVIPYSPAWNTDHDDSRRDELHFVVNTALNHLGLLLLPLATLFIPARDLWSMQWPFWLQAIVAIVVMDVGVAAAHYASHKWSALWRFHAVHHSVRRLYGFNGLMKHPVHQAIEGLSGLAPLLLIGIPARVATAVVFCVGIQLLLQHSNADYRTGVLKYVFATAEVHRFHHARGGAGDVNFGLFTTLWDHLAGTLYYAPAAAPSRSLDLGVDEPDYPTAYVAQLLWPFRRARPNELRAD